MLPFLALLTLAADPTGLRLESPILRRFEDGPPYEQSYRAGEQVFFDVRVAGYGHTEDETSVLKLAWTFQAFDAQARPLDAPVSGKLEATLNAQDTDYRPRVRFSATVPLFALEGAYRIQLALTDEVAAKTVEGSFPFRVRGKQLRMEAPLSANSVRFFRHEDDPAPLVVPVYRAGSEVWLRFDLEGYTVPEGNGFRVNYGVTVTGPDGKRFLQQDPAAAQRGSGGYPQEYVPATFVIHLPAKALVGEYRVAIVVRDLVSQRDDTTMAHFRVE